MYHLLKSGCSSWTKTQHFEYAGVKVAVSHWSYLDIFFDMTNNFMIENEKIPRQNDTFYFSQLY